MLRLPSASLWFFGYKIKNRRLTTAVLFFFDIKQNVTDLAMKNGTKIVKRDSADRLVVLESVKQASANMVLINQFISRYPFFLDCSVKWSKRNHIYHL